MYSTVVIHHTSPPHPNTPHHTTPHISLPHLSHNKQQTHLGAVSSDSKGQGKTVNTKASAFRTQDTKVPSTKDSWKQLVGWYFLLNPPPAAAHGPAPSGPSTVTWGSKTSISVDQLWGVSGEVPANVPVRVFPFQKYTRGGMHEGKERAGKEKVRAFSGKRRGAYFTGEGRKEVTPTIQSRGYVN